MVKLSPTSLKLVQSVLEGRLHEKQAGTKRKLREPEGSDPDSSSESDSSTTQDEDSATSQEASPGHSATTTGGNDSAGSLDEGHTQTNASKKQRCQSEKSKNCRSQKKSSPVKKNPKNKRHLRLKKKRREAPQAVSQHARACWRQQLLKHNRGIEPGSKPARFKTFKRIDTKVIQAAQRAVLATFPEAGKKYDLLKKFQQYHRTLIQRCSAGKSVSYKKQNGEVIKKSYPPKDALEILEEETAKGEASVTPANPTQCVSEKAAPVKARARKRGPAGQDTAKSTVYLPKYGARVKAIGPKTSTPLFEGKVTGFEGQDTDYGRCPILCVVLFVELVYQSDNIDIEEEDMQALRDRDLTQDVAKRLEPQMTLEAGVTVWWPMTCLKETDTQAADPQPKKELERTLHSVGVASDHDMGGEDSSEKTLPLKAPLDTLKGVEANVSIEQGGHTWRVDCVPKQLQTFQKGRFTAYEPLEVYQRSLQKTTGNVNVLLLPSATSDHLFFDGKQASDQKYRILCALFKGLDCFQYPVWVATIHYNGHFSVAVITNVGMTQQGPPILYHLDSLKGIHNTEYIAKQLSHLLRVRWREQVDSDKFPQSEEDTQSSKLQIVVPSVDQQDAGSNDCGLFSTLYALKAVQSPPQQMSKDALLHPGIFGSLGVTNKEVAALRTTIALHCIDLMLEQSKAPTSNAVELLGQLREAFQINRRINWLPETEAPSSVEVVEGDDVEVIPSDKKAPAAKTVKASKAKKAAPKKTAAKKPARQARCSKRKELARNKQKKQASDFVTS